MKQKISVFITLFLCLAVYSVSAQSKINARASTNISKTTRPTITVLENTIVPEKNIFYLYDEAGTTLLQTFSSGQRVFLSWLKKNKKEAKDPPKIDCVQINCPEKFGSNVDCWKCK
ncbi:MAG: hypothetical protein ICV66_10740 [Chitinophagaceae bacterium]|nr:hypothetical protein [Chitinophagaceae bacterium]